MKSIYTDDTSDHRVCTTGEVDLRFRYDEINDRWQWKTDRKYSTWYPVENLDGSPDDELKEAI